MIPEKEEVKRFIRLGDKVAVQMAIYYRWGLDKKKIVKPYADN